MNRIILALLGGAACLCADTTTVDSVVTETVKPTVVVVPEEKWEITPIIKAEMVVVAENKDNTIIELGSNDLGLTVSKGDLEITGTVSVKNAHTTPEISVSKMYFTKGVGEMFSVTAGYKNLPYGHWTSNMVNYPGVRLADNLMKEKNYQLGVGFNKGIVCVDVAGYRSSINDQFNAASAKASLDLTIIDFNASVKTENLDNVHYAFGTTLDFGMFEYNMAVSRDVDENQEGAYAEFTVIPLDGLLPSVRVDYLSDETTTFGGGVLILVNDNVYTGLQYDAICNIADDNSLEKPNHVVTMLLGCEF